MANLRNPEPWETVSSTVSTAVEAVICHLWESSYTPFFLMDRLSVGAGRRQATTVYLLDSLIPFIFLSFLVFSSPKAYLRTPVRSRSSFESCTLKLVLLFSLTKSKSTCIKVHMYTHPKLNWWAWIALFFTSLLLDVFSSWGGNRLDSLALVMIIQPVKSIKPTYFI